MKNKTVLILGALLLTLFVSGCQNSVFQDLVTGKSITAFSFKAVNNPELGTDFHGEINGNDIYLTVPEGTDLSSLVASFSTTGPEVSVGYENQISGARANDFSSPVSYTVTAADKSAAEYVVTVEWQSLDEA